MLSIFDLGLFRLETGRSAAFRSIFGDENSNHQIRILPGECHPGKKCHDKYDGYRACPRCGCIRTTY